MTFKWLKRGDRTADSIDTKPTFTTKSGIQPVQTNRPQAATAASDPLADDLMRRVFRAIDSWIADNHLDTLPRHLAFQQALSILNALDRTTTREP